MSLDGQKPDGAKEGSLLFETDPIPRGPDFGLPETPSGASAFPAGAGPGPCAKKPVTPDSGRPFSNGAGHHAAPARGSAGPGTARRSLGFARSIGWVTLLLLVILSMVLSSYLGSRARDTLVSRQHTFSTLLADYLNNQIYRRFTMPTVSFFGRITLSRPEQYKALDQVIQSITSGLQVEELRIYAHEYTVT